MAHFKRPVDMDLGNLNPKFEQGIYGFEVLRLELHEGKEPIVSFKLFEEDEKTSPGIFRKHYKTQGQRARSELAAFMRLAVACGLNVDTGFTESELIGRKGFIFLLRKQGFSQTSGFEYDFNDIAYDGYASMKSGRQKLVELENLHGWGNDIPQEKV